MSDENTSTTDDTTGEVENTEQGEQQEQDGGKESSLAKALHAERQTIKELKAQLHELRQSQEKVRLESLSEAERAVEEAKRAGYEEAMASVKADLTKSKVTAAAAAAGFADPGDASGFLDVAALDSDDDISKAVADLAKAKPYLLKRTAQSLEQGQQGKSKNEGPNDWLRSALGAR